MSLCHCPHCSTLLALIEASKSNKKGSGGGGGGGAGEQKFVDDFLEEKSASQSAASSGPAADSQVGRGALMGNITTIEETMAGSDTERFPGTGTGTVSVLPAFVPDFSLPPSVYQPPVREDFEEESQLRQLHPEPPRQQEQEQEQQQQQQQNMDMEMELNNENKETEDAHVPPTKRMLLMELFTKSGMAKVDMVLQSVETFLADPLSGKLLIFAHHKKVLDRLSEFLATRGTDFIRIDGSTVSKARHQKMLRFQTVPTCRVAVLAITAAGKLGEGTDRISFCICLSSLLMCDHSSCVMLFCGVCIYSMQGWQLP